MQASNYTISPMYTTTEVFVYDLILLKFKECFSGFQTGKFVDITGLLMANLVIIFWRSTSLEDDDHESHKNIA